MNDIETVGAFKQVYELSHNNDLKYDFKFLDKVKEAYACRGVDFPTMFNDYYLREFRSKEEQEALAGWCSGKSTEKPKNEQKKVSTGERVPYVNNNFIKLSRKILDWQWYTDEHTKTLFIHCLLKANWKEGNFKGVVACCCRSFRPPREGIRLRHSRQREPRRDMRPPENGRRPEKSLRPQGWTGTADRRKRKGARQPGSLRTQARPTPRPSTR